MDMPWSNTEATLLVDPLEEFFSSNESDLASDSEFEPPSPDSMDPTTDSQPPSKLPIRTLLRLDKDASWDITLGDIVKEIFPHFQPVLASTIKEVLSENNTASHCVCMSSINGSGVTFSSKASENFLFRDPHASPFVQLSYDEEMAEMEKILDNPWIPDETIDRAVVPSTNPNQISQDQHHSLVQTQRTAIWTQNTTTKLQKLIRIFIFSMLCIIVFVIIGVVTFVMLELDFYGGARVREGGIWLRLMRQPQRNRFFLSSNFV